MMTTEDMDGVEAARAERVADRLHSASIHLLRRLRRQDDASGVTAPHLSALSVLVFGGARTLGELAAAEQVTPPSMTRIVRNLEAGGLVARKLIHKRGGHVDGALILDPRHPNQPRVIRVLGEALLVRPEVVQEPADRWIGEHLMRQPSHRGQLPRPGRGAAGGHIGRLIPAKQPRCTI